MRPPKRSVTAWAPPRYGTLLICAPVMRFNVSANKCGVVPDPKPKFNLFGFARAKATTWATVLAGTSGATTSTCDQEQRLATGARLFVGSNCRWGYSVGMYT